MAAFLFQRGERTPFICDRAPHSTIEASLDHGDAASPSRSARVGGRPGGGGTAGLIGGVLLAVALLTGCTETCLLNGECPGETVCLEGTCRTPCVLDTACPVEQFCLGGGCRALEPGERAPCRDDAGCLEPDMLLEAEPDAAPDALSDPDGAPDAALLDLAVDMGSPPDGGAMDGAGADAALLDGAVLDGAGPDAMLLDGGGLDGAVSDATLLDGGTDLGPLTDGFLADGGLGVDLTGLYAVTTTVIVATGGDLAAEDELRHIHRLDWLGGTRHRLEVFATDGAFEHAAEVDLASPDGPGRYQYEYPLAVPSPEGCAGTELRFQRGLFEPFEPGWRLLAGEERTVRFEGEQCGADGYLVRVDMVWTPLPPP